MAYPAKTSAAAIRRVALAQLEAEGAGALSLRRIAAALGVTPNALYRYYPDRDALLAVLADEGARALHAAMARATRGRSGVEAARALRAAYLAFARKRPALYEVLMHVYRKPGGSGQLPGGRPRHEELWQFVVALLVPTAGVARAPEAGVALWAYLHGVVGLERARLLTEHKPRSAVDYGFNALLAGLTR